MNDYADTGFLCSLYAPDAHSLRAITLMKRQAVPLAFTWIHQLEFRNALRLRVFRGEIAPKQGQSRLTSICSQMDNGSPLSILHFLSVAAFVPLRI